MQFEVVSDPAQLAAMRDPWSRLAVGSPMQSFDWLATWWDCYANSSCDLHVIVGRVDGELCGIAPWYVERQRGRRVLRWLGDGRVCSDHATLICPSAQDERFAQSLAVWMQNSSNDGWDEIQLEAIDEDDPACRRLIDDLVAAGCSRVQAEQPGNCYVELPPTLNEYLMSISKNHRKRCRRWQKQFFDTGRARLEVATGTDYCLRNWHSLVELHNTRRSSLGERGAFEDHKFAKFHQQVIPKLAASGNVQLRVLEVDGTPMAAEYVLRDQRTCYAYQSGMSASGEEVSAGSLSIFALVRDAIDAGCQRLDLLRGDEPYKFSWGAVHRPASSITLRRPSSAARLLTLRDSAWIAAKRLRRSVVG